MVESVSRRRAVGLKAMLFFSSFSIVGIFWYYNNRQIQTYDNRMWQSISTDTLDAEMKLESNAPSETLIYTDYTKVLPPSETLRYTDYTKILPEVKKVIDEDVKPIDALGQPFDPNFHNAVMQVESEEFETGVVAQELQKGYTHHGNVVRHSMVSVVK